MAVCTPQVSEAAELQFLFLSLIAAGGLLPYCVPVQHPWAFEGDGQQFDGENKIGWQKCLRMANQNDSKHEK